MKIQDYIQEKKDQENEELDFSYQERQQLLKAQSDLCDKNTYPHFAPFDGYCPFCGRDIVDNKWVVELITGCKLCHKSYCD